MKTDDILENIESARARASLSMLLSASQGWINVHDLATGDLSESTKIERGEPMPPEVLKLIDKVAGDVPEAVKQCTVRGKGEKIKTNKPKDGIYAYVWRMARFNSGADMRMPVMADFDLSIGIEDKTGYRISFAIADSPRKKILDKLEALSDKVVKAVKGDPMAAARRWAPILGRPR